MLKIAPGASLLRAISLVSWALLALPASATDWYWRPNNGGPYGAGDGRSYQSAWRTSTSIDWSRILPGDTLYVCGTHDSGYPDNGLRVGSSGRADNPVRISGDCPSDPGHILAAGGKWTDGWSKPDVNGVVYRDYGGKAGQIVDEGGLVQRLESRPDGRSPCRSFAQVGRTVFYKPCGQTRALFPQGQAPVIEVREKDFVHIDKLGVSNADILVSVENAQGFRLTRSKLQFGRSYSFIATGNTSNGVLSENEISDAGNGPYFVTEPPKSTRSHDGWTVTANWIHDIFGTTDSHCIGWQAGNNNVISRNTLRNCEGSGITIYDTAFGARLQNNKIEDNDIQTVRSRGKGGSNHRGIEIGSTNCPNHPDDDRGNLVRNNRIRDTEGPGIYIKAGRPTTAGVFTWRFIGNTVDGASDGVYWVDTNWYGKVPPSGGDRDPCALSNRIPSLSAPGFLLEENHFLNVRNSFITPQPLEPNLQSSDSSGIVARRNTFHGEGVFIWQGNRQACPAGFRQSLNLCRLPDLDTYRLVSGKEQDSIQVNDMPPMPPRVLPTQ